MFTANKTLYSKIKWTPEEDNQLKVAVERFGKKWKHVCTLVPFRTAKQCRERWTSQLDPSISKLAWSEEEEQLLLRLQVEHGNHWARISTFMPGRSPNCVKNHYKFMRKNNMYGLKYHPSNRNDLHRHEDPIVKPGTPEIKEGQRVDISAIFRESIFSFEFEDIFGFSELNLEL